MPDNVSITAGTGTVIATDEVAVNGGSVAHVQYVKLTDGTADGTAGIPGGATGLWTVPRRDLIRSTAISTGLTTVTPAYSAGDQMGGQFTLTNAARVTGGSGYIVGVTLISDADNIGAVDVVFTDSSIPLAADNAAYLISDDDAVKIIGIVPLSGAYDIGANRVAQLWNLSIPYVCSGGTSIFAGLITRSAHGVFIAATDLQLNVYLERN